MSEMLQDLCLQIFQVIQFGSAIVNFPWNHRYRHSSPLGLYMSTPDFPCILNPRWRRLTFHEAFNIFLSPALVFCRMYTRFSLLSPLIADISLWFDFFLSCCGLEPLLSLWSHQWDSSILPLLFSSILIKEITSFKEGISSFPRISILTWSYFY